MYICVRDPLNKSTILYVCIFHWFPEGLQVFFKVLSFCTHSTLSVLPYQPLSTSSGSILGARASCASPGISIGRTAYIVVVHTPYIRAYIWSYLSVLLYRWDFVSGIEPETCFQSFGHHTKALALSFGTYSFRWIPNHRELENRLEKIHWCWSGFEPGPPD